MSETPEVLYHYTTGTVLPKLLFQEAILPDRCEPANEKEIPTVTFSADPIWEKSRFRVGKMKDGKVILMSMMLLKKYDGGLIRIVVPKSIAPMDWADMKDKCNISREALKGIYEFALDVGARTRDWYGTTEVVPLADWISIQKMNDIGQWLDIPEDELPTPSDGLPKPVMAEGDEVDICMDENDLNTAEEVGRL